MNNKTLKSLTNAHAWIGLIISIVLFVVFFAGSISLFRDNIIAWEKLPSYATQTAQATNQEANYDKVIARIHQSYDVYVDHRFYLFPPSEHVPFVEAYFAKNIEGFDPETGEDHTDVHILLDPKSGEILGDASQFQYGNFVYALHYNLGLGTAGLYFVGVITLFFFVAVLSGLVIHWRKLFKNFFQYRKAGDKDKWLDAHNIIGTMGLPFHVMYAFTGLVFNLVIVYQISYALVLYQGDQNKLLAAAGYDEPHLDIVDKSAPITGINDLKRIANQAMGENVYIDRIMIEHFGDESAVAIFKASRTDRFATETEAHYKINTQEQIYLTQDNHDNAVRSGLLVISRLHFGDFAGYGMRIAFFLLGLATCYVILTGNLMWINKRAKQRSQSQRSLNFVRRMTSGGFIGLILAIGSGFMLARGIPSEMINRSNIIENAVYLVFIATFILSLCCAKQFSFSKWALRLSAFTFAFTIVLDWLLFSHSIADIVASGNLDIIITQVMLLMLALICLFSAAQVKKKANQSVDSITSPLNDDLTVVAK